MGGEGGGCRTANLNHILIRTILDIIYIYDYMQDDLGSGTVSPSCLSCAAFEKVSLCVEATSVLGSVTDGMRRQVKHSLCRT